MAGTTGSYMDAVTRAESAAKKALELAPESAEVHEAMANVQMGLDRIGPAKTELEEAIRINPNLANAHDLLGDIHSTFGRFDESIAAFRKALSLDPVSAHTMNDLARGLRISGRVDEALSLYEKMKLTFPDSPVPFEGEAVCYTQKGDTQRALEELARAVEVEPGNRMMDVYRGWIYALQGEKADAEKVLESLADAPPNVRRHGVILTALGLGEVDRAMDELMVQAKDHSWYSAIGSDPIASALRTHPRWGEFCAQVGLTST